MQPSTDKRNRHRTSRKAPPSHAHRASQRVLWALPLGGLLLAAASQPALASCSSNSFHDPAFFPNNLNSNSTVTCTGTTATRVGQGPGAFGVTLNVLNGATIAVTNDNAISLGAGGTITLGTGAGPAVVVQTTTNGGATGGQYGTGDNTIEFDSNTKLIINKNASVIATGTQPSAEAINPYGSGNLILNYGVIQGGPSNAIFFENVGTTASSPRNVIDNYGQIISPNHDALGSNGAVGIDFINETGASVIGNLIFGGGDDRVTLNPKSSVTGTLDGGGGFNTLTLNASGTSADTFAGQINNFQQLTKTGGGMWTLTGQVGDNGGAAPLSVTVYDGTLLMLNPINRGGSANLNSGLSGFFA